MDGPARARSEGGDNRRGVCSGLRVAGNHEFLDMGSQFQEHDFQRGAVGQENGQLVDRVSTQGLAVVFSVIDSLHRRHPKRLAWHASLS